MLDQLVFVLRSGFYNAWWVLCSWWPFFLLFSHWSTSHHQTSVLNEYLPKMLEERRGVKLKVSLKELAMPLQTSLEPPTSHWRNRRTDLTWPKLHLAQESSAQQDAFVQAIHLDIWFNVALVSFTEPECLFAGWTVRASRLRPSTLRVRTNQ